LIARQVDEALFAIIVIWHLLKEISGTEEWLNKTTDCDDKLLTLKFYPNNPGEKKFGKLIAELNQDVGGLMVICDCCD